MTNELKFDNIIIDKINYINEIMTDFYINQYNAYRYNDSVKNYTYNDTRYSIKITSPTTIEITLKSYFNDEKNIKIINIDFEKDYVSDLDNNPDHGSYPDTETSDIFHYLQYEVGLFNNDDEII